MKTIIKTGDILIAIDECVIKINSERCLIIGKEYIVMNHELNRFTIKSEKDEYHFFTQNKWHKFFKLKITQFNEH